LKNTKKSGGRDQGEDSHKGKGNRSGMMAGKGREKTKGRNSNAGIEFFEKLYRML